MEKKVTFEAIRFQKTLKGKKGKELERKEFKTTTEAYDKIRSWLEVYGGVDYYYTTSVKIYNE